MALKTTPASKIFLLCIAWTLGICLFPVLLLALILLLVILWKAYILPNATVHYDKNGTEELRYIWNVQHRIYKGRLPPGASTTDQGFLFPDEKFFMMFDWQNKDGRPRCVYITPSWFGTHMYLNANGDIDHSEGSATDSDRLKPCPSDTARP
jgi:hypothetical protein